MRTQKPDKILCKCGCKIEIYLYDNRGRKRKFLKEHKGRGRIRLTKGQKISRKNKGKRFSIKTEFKEGIKPWNTGLVGKLNPLWKNNKITPIKKWIRHTQKYIDWHTFILVRDNYTCQICGKRGGILHVDHFPESFMDILNKYNIKNFKEVFDIEELFDVNNGRTLCIFCHQKTPSYGGRQKKVGGIYAR